MSLPDFVPDITKEECNIMQELLMAAKKQDANSIKKFFEKQRIRPVLEAILMSEAIEKGQDFAFYLYIQAGLLERYDQ